MPREFALPGTRPRYAPDRTCDIEHYRIEVDLDLERRRITGRCAITLTPITDRLRWIHLDAIDMEIAAAKEGDRAVAWTYDGQKLRLEIGREVREGEQITLVIDYAAAPRRGLYFVGPDQSYPNKPVQVWSQGQDEDSRHWFPCFDSPHEKATSEVIVAVPAEMTALSNGVIVDDQTEGDRRRIHWRFDHPHSCYLITLVAGRLSELVDDWDGIDVAYYVEPGREDEARRTLGKTPQMLELFSRLYRVRYPYPRYAQVFVSDFIFGGMENTTATTLTDTVLLDARAAIDTDFEGLVSHELAHQWFGDLLTCRAWAEGWLNEGFATYAEYLWREHSEGRDAAAVELDDWAEQYFHEDAGRYRRTLATNVYDAPIDIFDHHLYEKGARILHMLRRILGEEPFWRSIGHYLAKHRTGTVETRDLARAIEEATGRVLDWFFEQWVIKSAGHPELSVSYSWDAETRQARVTIKQTQKVEGLTPLFRVPTQVRFRVGAADRDFDIELRDEQQTFAFGFDAAPSQAIFDPGKHVLARVDADKPDAMWITELADASEAIDRIAAARKLATRGGRAVTDALIASLDGDPFWGVRAAAAAALGELRTATARDALIAAIASTEHPRARRAVIKALGNFRGDVDAAAALTAVIERGDPSYFVEAEACLALGRTRAASAPAVLRRAADRDSFADVIRQHVWRGLAEARDDSAIDILSAATEYGRHPYGRRAAMLALASLARGRKDREARDVRELLELRLRDVDFRVQHTAIEALAALADPTAIGALEQLAARDLDGRLRRRSREVIRDLKEGRAQADELRSLRDDVDKLRAQAIELKERLDAIAPAPRSRAENGVRTPHPRTPALRATGGGKKRIRER